MACETHSQLVFRKRQCLRLTVYRKITGCRRELHNHAVQILRHFDLTPKARSAAVRVSACVGNCVDLACSDVRVFQAKSHIQHILRTPYISSGTQ